MPGGPEMDVTRALSGALAWVLDTAPTGPEPVVVLAAYLDALAKGYGLSGSMQLDVNPLESAEPPAPAAALINHFLADGAASIDEDTIPARLYSALVDLSQDLRARKLLNTNNPLTEVGLLYLGQIYWNLEATQARPKLPIRTRHTVTGKQASADIPVPNADRDFATMRYAARASEKGPYKSSGQGFRTQGARLAVLVAEQVVKCNPQPPPTLEGASLRFTSSEPGERWVTAIVWPDRPSLAALDTVGAERERRGLGAGKQRASDHRSLIEHSYARIKLANAFQGRERELDELTKFCAAGEEHRLLLVGERYSGKSALMAEFFVGPQAPDAVRLGYFVPPSQRQDARSEAMVRHLVRQAYLLTAGEELHIDSSNPGRLRELLATCVGQAKQDGRSVVLLVDGIDEDLSNRLQEQAMMSVLDEISVPELKMIVSAWSDRIPEAAAGWRQLHVRRTEYVAECLKQMEAELEGLFDQAPARGILQYLTFGFGAFQADELAQLTGGNVRAIRKTLTGSEERVFSAVREPGEEDRWAFAHPKYAEVARALFDESAGAWPAGELTSATAVSAEAETEVRLEAWAESFRNAGWPTETPRHLLTHYPEYLAERGDLTGLCQHLLDPGYLRAIACRFGPANPISFLVDQAMPLALRAAQADGSTASLETMAKLGTVRINYLGTADTVPLVLRFACIGSGPQGDGKFFVGAEGGTRLLDSHVDVGRPYTTPRRQESSSHPVGCIRFDPDGHDLDRIGKIDDGLTQDAEDDFGWHAALPRRPNERISGTLPGLALLAVIGGITGHLGPAQGRQNVAHQKPEVRNRRGRPGRSPRAQKEHHRLRVSRRHVNFPCQLWGLQFCGRPCRPRNPPGFA